MVPIIHINYYVYLIPNTGGIYAMLPGQHFFNAMLNLNVHTPVVQETSGFCFYQWSRPDMTYAVDWALKANYLYLPVDWVLSAPP